MDKNKRSMILKSGAFLTALVATGLVNNGVSADETATPTGPTDNATVATGHSDTLLPPASSTPATMQKPPRLPQTSCRTQTPF